MRLTKISSWFKTRVINLKEAKEFSIFSVKNAGCKIPAFF
jgi:hypothetical protein